MLQDYINYFKNNPQGYWFKRKVCGWGWVPVRWQGWFVILIFVAVVTHLGVKLGARATVTNKELLWFFGKIVVAVALLIIICYKTGEPPRWQWGLPNKTKNK